MKNKVTLNIDKDIVCLSGYHFGKSIYCSQVKGNIDISKNCNIEIPTNVKLITSSFVQGFFSDIIDEIGLLTTEERIHIIHENTLLSKSVMNKL